MRTQNAAHLTEYGPSTVAEVPGDQIHHYDDVEKFVLSGSPATRMGGPVTPVYYLEEHNREAVLRRFLEANPGLVEEKSFRAFQILLSGQTSGWKEASRAIRDEFFDKPEARMSTEGVDNGECPNCGEELSFKGLPSHLRSGCEELA